MRDLKEETGKNRQLVQEKGVQKSGGLVTTPKKQKALPHRDGFDDDEIEVLSPSKVSPSKFQKRLIGTPIKQGKRKRKVFDSPAGQLEIQVEAQSDGGSEAKSNALDEAVLEKLAIRDDRYDVGLINPGLVIIILIFDSFLALCLIITLTQTTLGRWKSLENMHCHLLL